jgi:transposase
LAREDDLPAAFTDEQAREVKLVLARREDLVAERTRVINRLRWHLHELDPEIDPAPRALIHRPAREQVRELIEASEGIVAEIAGMVLADLERLCSLISELDTRLRAVVRDLEPQLLEIPGCAELSAAKIIAETAGIERFATESKFAMFAGCAPIPVWSGKTEGRVRLNRGGNRQLNCAIHRIAITQTRLEGPGKEYYERLRADGKTVMEALRCLKNQIARRLWRTLTRAHADALTNTPIPLTPTSTTCVPQAA